MRLKSLIRSLGWSWIFAVSIGCWKVLLKGNRLDSSTLHERAHLGGYFFENFFVQVASGDALVELDELDDIARDELTHRVTEAAVVAIELFHEGEVCVSNTDNDDRAGEITQLVYGILGRSHVMDGSISQDKEDLVLL